MKSIQLLLLVLIIVVSGSTAQADQFMDWYKKISSTERQLGVHILPKENIQSLLNDAEPLIQQGTDEPRFYLQLAIFVQTLHGYYYDENYPLGKYRPDSPESQALVEKYSSYYRMTLDADENPSAPWHMDIDALSAITNSTLMATDVMERALKKELSLVKSGKVQISNENFEWNTYEALLDLYAKIKDDQNYLKTVNEMMERFPNSSRMDELENYKQQVESVIEQRDKK